MALLFLLIPMLLAFSSLQGAAFAGVQVQTPYAVVKIGDPIVMLCKGDGPLKYCRMNVPGESSVIVVSESLNRPNLKYEGAGLESGQCGIKIDHAEARHNGVFQCSFPVEQNTEASGNMTVVIAQPPTPPEMIVGTPGTQGIDSYKEGDLFSAKCVVRNGRPVTNFTWYLGDVLLNEGLTTPVFTPSRNDLYTTEQNITRSLQSYDNGKEIRCIADHPGLNEGTKSTKRLIKVEYGPKPAVKKFEHFGLVEGSEGRISVVVEANPRPNFIWKIGQISVVEEQTEDRFFVEKAVKQGSGSWESVLVINSLTKEDVDQEYTVKATNNLGERTYSVEISTSPEPKVLSIGTGTIIVIIFILVLVFILIGGVLFARAKGRWCFAGTLTVAPRLAGESSDTESADHTTSELKPKRTFISVFKKSSDKVATIPEEAPPKMDTDDKPSEESDRLKEKEDTEGNATSDDNGEGVVYAELDIQARRNDEGPAIVRGDDDKTEYAEIIHVKNHPKQ